MSKNKRARARKTPKSRKAAAVALRRHGSVGLDIVFENEKCEGGCKAPVVGHDSEGIPLCRECLDMLADEDEDTRRIDWLQAQEVKRARDTGTHGKDFDFLVLAEDGTTCWGKTYRAAIDAAMAHGNPPNEKDEPTTAPAPNSHE